MLQGSGQAFRPSAQEVKIKYENTTLPGILQVDTSNKKGRWLLSDRVRRHPGELYAGGGVPPWERGLHVLTFEGPGQERGCASRGCHFRPDWEKVVTPW